MKYKAIEQTVDAVQITPDIEMIVHSVTEQSPLLDVRSILMHGDIKAADLLQE